MCILKTQMAISFTYPCITPPRLGKISILLFAPWYQVIPPSHFCRELNFAFKFYKNTYEHYFLHYIVKIRYIYVIIIAVLTEF